MKASGDSYIIASNELNGSVVGEECSVENYSAERQICIVNLDTSNSEADSHIQRLRTLLPTLQGPCPVTSEQGQLCDCSNEVMLFSSLPPSADMQAAVHTLAIKGKQITVVRMYKSRSIADSRWTIDGSPEINYLNVAVDDPSDWDRLLRYLHLNAIGIVFSGGGARGFIHLGVAKALIEANIPFDAFGGSSVGSVVSACFARGIPFEQVVEMCRLMGTVDPTGEGWNPLPVYSLKRGHRLRDILEEIFGSLDFSGLWYPNFCVASNLMKDRVEVLESGKVYRAMQASTAIPVFFPPYVIDGELLVDGALMDNLPIRHMSPHVNRIIAIDLSSYRQNYTPTETAEVPSVPALLKNRILSRKSRSNIPKLPALLMKALFLNSQANALAVRDQAALYLNPPFGGFGFFDWNKWEEMIEFGYRYAEKQLANKSFLQVFSEAEPEYSI